MKQKCIEKKIEILDALEKYEIYTIPNVLEELCYKIIMEIIAKKKNTNKFYELKSFFERGVCEDEIKMLFHSINLAKEISIKYKLLPNDALIAATCKYYGISKIANISLFIPLLAQDFRKISLMQLNSFP